MPEVRRAGGRVKRTSTGPTLPWSVAEFRPHDVVEANGFALVPKRGFATLRLRIRHAPTPWMADALPDLSSEAGMRSESEFPTANGASREPACRGALPHDGGTRPPSGVSRDAAEGGLVALGAG